MSCPDPRRASPARSPRPARPPRPARRRALALGLALALAAGVAAADTVVLKDGRRIPGQVVRRTRTELVLRTGLGEVTFPLDQVVEVIEEKTDREVFAERLAAAETADACFELGEWARKKRLKSLAKQAWERACELDPDHAPSRGALGQVSHRGEWMTPEERDRRVREEEAREMTARGLVRHGDRWVTPEEQAKLEAGLVLHGGEWMTPERARREQGLERYRDGWLPRAEALARTSADLAAEASGARLDVVVNDQLLLAGDVHPGVLDDTAAKLAVLRAWFDGAWGTAPGLDLLGGRLAEFYLFERDAEPYRRTTPLFASWTTTLPEGWVERAVDTHGFYWSDPYALSSVRLWNRDEQHLYGHCLHHWGHLLANRLDADGRLLPPWYDEAVAALFEFRDAGRNTIFCRVATSGGTGTGAEAAAVQLFDPQFMVKGSWREALRAALEAGAVKPFDRLAALEFSELQHVDVAVGMAVLTWLEARAAEPGPDGATGSTALARFHAALRERAPLPPDRVRAVASERHARYDAAFEAAVGMGWRAADREWRTWFLKP